MSTNFTFEFYSIMFMNKQIKL